MSDQKRKPSNLSAEPPYPGLHCVVLSLRAPDWTAHVKSKRCSIEEPHLISECGEFVGRVGR